MVQVISFYETPSPAGLTGIKAWLLTHDHKRLALMYLWAVFFWLVLAVFLGMALRLELMFIGETIMPPEIYNCLLYTSPSPRD